MLEIKGLKSKVKKEPILKGVDLSIHDGEIHALMGKNGCGKSSLLATIMGSEIFKINAGKIILDGTEIQKLDANLRSDLGLFMTFQSPYDFFEVRTVDILTRIWNKTNKQDKTSDEFVAANRKT